MPIVSTEALINKAYLLVKSLHGMNNTHSNCFFNHLKSLWEVAICTTSVLNIYGFNQSNMQQLTSSNQNKRRKLKILLECREGRANCNKPPKVRPFMQSQPWKLQCNHKVASAISTGKHFFFVKSTIVMKGTEGWLCSKLWSCLSTKVNPWNLQKKNQKEASHFCKKHCLNARYRGGNYCTNFKLPQEARRRSNALSTSSSTMSLIFTIKGIFFDVTLLITITSLQDYFSIKKKTRNSENSCQ